MHIVQPDYDKQFAELCEWLKVYKCTAHTTRSQTLIIRRKPDTIKKKRNIK